MPYQTINPATGALVRSFDDSTDDELEAAVTVAHAAYEKDWRQRAVSERAGVVSLAARRLRDNAEEYAACVTLEMGKLIAEARAEVALSADILDYYATRAAAYNRTPDQPGLWNGPYILTEFKANESVTFAPNPYWDGEKPAFKQVTVKLIPSSAALEANLLSGDIDIANGLGFDQDTDLEKHYAGRFDVQMLPGTNVTNYVYLNIQTPILADKLVRQAIAMGIDKQTIVDRLFGGRAAVANSIIATADPNYDKNLKPWPYDPAGARASLAAAGYKPGSDGIMVRADGTRLSLDLIAGAGAATAGLVQQVVQSELKQIGIEAVAKAEPFRVLDGTTLPRRLYKGMVIEWESRAPGSLPLSTIGSAGIPSEANAFSGWNVTGYSNPHVDNLLKDALAELDPVKRQAMWNDIQATVMNDLPKFRFTTRPPFTCRRHG